MGARGEHDGWSLETSLVGSAIELIYLHFLCSVVEVCVLTVHGLVVTHCLHLILWNCGYEVSVHEIIDTFLALMLWGLLHCIKYPLIEVFLGVFVHSSLNEWFLVDIRIQIGRSLILCLNQICVLTVVILMLTNEPQFILSLVTLGRLITRLISLSHHLYYLFFWSIIFGLVYLLKNGLVF